MEPMKINMEIGGELITIKNEPVNVNDAENIDGDSRGGNGPLDKDKEKTTPDSRPPEERPYQQILVGSGPGATTDRDNLANKPIVDETTATDDPSDSKNSLIIEIAPIYSNDGEVTYSLLVADAESLDVKNNSVQKSFEDCVKVIRDIGSKWNKAHGREGLEEATHDDDHSIPPNYENTATGAEDDISIATNASTGTRPSSSTSQEASNPIQLNKTDNISAKAGTSFTANLRKSLRIKKTPPRYSEYYDDDYEEYILSKKRSKKLRGIGSNHQNTGMAQSAISSSSRLGNEEKSVAIRMTRKIHRCETCGISFKRSYTLKQHLMVHSNERPFKCTKCPQSFKRNEILKKHTARLHSTNPIKKPPSSKPAALKQKQAILKPSGAKKSSKLPKKSTCQICRRTFPNKTALLRHIKIHNPNRNRLFLCNLCQNSYLILSHLRNHQKYCSKIEIKAKCQLCGALFNTKGALATHLKIIHGETNPFQCDICMGKFTNGSNLRRHVAALHGK